MKKILTLILVIAVVLCSLSSGIIGGASVSAADTNVDRYTVLIIDTSSKSEFYEDELIYTADSAIDEVKKTSQKFISDLIQSEGNNKVAVISYGDEVSLISDFTSNLNELNDRIGGLTELGNTRNMTGALEKAYELLSGVTSEGAIKNTVLVTTGFMNEGAYNYTGEFSEDTVGSRWRRMDTQIRLYAYANSALEAASDVKEISSLYVLGIFDTMNDIRDESKDVAELFKLTAKTLATSENYFYEVDDIDALEFRFGEVAEDISHDTSLARIPFKFGNQSSECFYTDEYFAQSSYVYNQSLGTMSLAFALSAFGTGDYKTYSKNAKDLLQKIGCKSEAIETNYWFTVKPSTDSIGVIIGSKKIKVNNSDCTLIALAVRGGGYEQEWASNFTIGRTGQHEGFDTAKNNVLEKLQDYVKSQNITGDVKFLITGYSRAAATANLVGGAMDSDFPISKEIAYDYDDIYTYCFETPAGALTSEVKNTKLMFEDKDSGIRYPRYNNIFSILNSSDPVPYVAPAAMGFCRYGVDKYLPSQQSDANYKYRRANMLSYLSKLTSDEYIVDNFQMKKISVEPEYKIVLGNVIVVPKAVIKDDLKNNYSQGVYLSNYLTLISKEFLRSRNNYVDNYENEIREICSIMFGSEQSQIDKLIDSLISQAKDEWPSFVASLLWNSGYKNDEAAAFQMLSDWLKKAVDDAGITDYDEATLNRVGINITDLLAAIATNHANYLASGIANGSGLGKAHYPDLCLAWMQSMDSNYWNPNKATFNTGSYRIVRINCEVDVQVNNSEGEKVAEIINEEPQTLNDSEIISSINDDGEKVVILPIDEDYTIGIVARSDDEVHYGIDEYCAVSGDYTRVLKYESVKLNKGEKLTGIVPAYSEEEIDDDLELMDGSDTKYRLIAPNGEEVKTMEIAGEEATDEYYSIKVTSSDEEKGIAMGTGMRQYGNYAQVEATAFDGYKFLGWFEGGKKISDSTIYRFQVIEDVELIAKFDSIEEADSKSSDKKVAPSDSPKPSETIKPSEEPKPSESTQPPHADTCPSKKFVDMNDTEGKWYHEGVDYALTKGYMAGMSDTTFNPSGNVTRAQITQILYAAEGKPAVSGNSTFTDVKAGKWYTDAVIWAASKDVVAGYPDGTFKPDKNVTREELATILYKYTMTKKDNMDITSDVLAKFPDVSHLHQYAVTPMEWAVSHNLISGTNKGLEPRDTATRAQIAVILQAYDKAFAK